jgi:ribosome maturation factor RimP
MLKQGIRQLRLSDPQIIKLRLKEFVGQNVNVVLHDRKAITGNLKTFNDTGVSILNMRQQKMDFTFDEIAEVYIDVIV